MKSTLITMTLAAATVGAANRTGSFSGAITDTMCKKDHARMKISPDAKCITECVKSHDGKFALFDGVNLYPLSDQKQPAQFAGRRVKVAGTLYEKTKIIKVDSIKAER